jgi:HEAT repeat protein
MLPGRFPTARIFTCDWPADLFEQPDFIQKTIEDFARLLLAGIKARPPATDDQPGSDRPIVFVASCLGGIVLIKALDMASREYLSVKKATRGIVFLATPFRGTSFQDVAKWAEPGLRAWASIQDKNVSNLLKDVKPTFELGELVRSFTTLCRENDLLDHVFTFYETGKSSLPRTIAPWLPASLSQEQPVQLPSLVLKPYSVEANVLQLVNKLSATPDFVGHPLPLDRPHRTMNKFSGPDDPGYVSVAGMLEVLLCDIRSGRPIEKADLWIRNNRYSPKELEIERLSGDLLPMDRCYINLAIVEKTGENAPPSKGEDEAQKVSPFSLLARLKVETLDKTIEVTLPTLFKRRKARDGQKRQPSRILIRGRAGVGKTTLCKKIVYEFTHGEKWQEWRDLFDRVLWVPLRNLKREERRRFRGYNSRHLFCDEYFSQHPRGDDLAEALWDATRATTSGRTLFILDGLDEVSQDLDGDMLSFLKELLNQPSVIITSRPHAMLPPGLDPIHLELETIGFYPDQVNAYVEKAFTDPETGKTDPEKPGEIQSYLQKHPLIQGLVRIPVQLDALCYTWSSFSDELIPQTMTGIYQAIEESLWKKDAVKLEIRTEAQMQFARPREIKSSIKTELYLLEALAFTGIHNDVIEFEPKHRDAISDQFNPTDSNLFLDGMLGRLSFLRTSDPSLKHRDRNYHFLHLTFQEYFAARYFVRQWKAGPLRCITLGDAENEYTKSADIEPATFLQMYKYHTRYDIFWRFVAGLLKDKAAGFFQTVEEEPRDILGPTHQRLIMHCLSEVSTGMAIRKTLEEKLSQWLLFECKFTQRSHLAAEMEFPEPALDTVLQSGPEDEDAKIILLGSLCRRAAIPPSVMDLAPSWLGVNVSQSLTLAILRLLGRQHKTLPSELLRAIAARIEDEASIVRYEALTALQGQTSLAPEMLQAISAKLEDGDRYVRCGAVKALQGQTLLAPEILQAIAARFEDEDSIVRWGAVKALQGQTLLTPEMLQAIAAQLADKSWPVRLAAIKALQNQTSLAPEILQAISAKLEDGDCYVRCGAVKALQGQTLLAPEILQAIAARLKDEDRIVRRAAVEALQGQASLTPAIVQAITVQLEDENSNVGQAAV